MTEWFKNWWWLVWAFAFAAALVAFRMRGRGGREPALRRIMYALFPFADPAVRPQRTLSGRFAIFLGTGIVLLSLLYLGYLESR
jgi:hypothetical protein